MIVFCHLLNDNSGSPLVLRQTIRALAQDGRGDMLFIGSQGRGCLEAAGVPIRRYWYRRSRFRVVTLFTYVASQIFMCRALRHANLPSDAVIYVNTLLPFGAALYGWVTGRPVIYHLHEVSISPAPLQRFLTAIARRTAHRLIFVSDFHRGCLPIPDIRSSAVHNALDENFVGRATVSAYRHRRDDQFRVLMLASLRDYKGVPELVALAERCSGRQDIRFDLVVNDDAAAIRGYFGATVIPTNLTVHPRTDDPGAFYAEASLVLNLSRPDQWVETFGLTLLEAMAFGVPVIAPPLGGPAELIADGREGFLIDSRNGEALANKVLQLANDEQQCLRLSAAARLRSADFSSAAFAEALQEALALISRRGRSDEDRHNEARRGMLTDDVSR